MLTGLVRSSWFYLVVWITWFFLLWVLSSGPLPGPKTPPQIPIDKILHWGYYGIGGALSTFFILAREKSSRLPARYFELLFLVGFFTGAIDEWHQSWYEFRSGNDFGDFLADCVGTYCGIKSAQIVWEILWKKLGHVGN